MRIEAIIAGQVHLGHAHLGRGLVISGGTRYPGVVVSGINAWVDEVTSYALNEGCVLFDTIRSDENSAFDIPWRVVYATSLELEATRLIRAAPPPGVVITTESRRIILVGSDGVMREKDAVLSSMTEIGESFTLELPGQAPKLTLKHSLTNSHGPRM